MKTLRLLPLCLALASGAHLAAQTTNPAPANASSTNAAATSSAPTSPAASGAPTINVDRSAFKSLTFSAPIMDLAESQRLEFGGGGKMQNGNQKQAYGLYVDALVACTSGDPRAVDATVTQLHDLVQPGHEPNAGGGLNGWTHHAIAQAFVLAKNTPEVWSKLSDDDKNRMDWIMKAMAVTGAFGFDDGNNYNTSLHRDDNFNKNWNPNHRLYLFVVISAAAYFGPDQLNQIFTSFDFDEYMKKFDELGFSNIKAVWSCYDWKPLMENGGTYTTKRGQTNTGTGVKHPFIYKGFPLTDLADIYCANSEDCYGEVVTNGIDGKSYILNNGVSPFVGQKGMFHEFNSKDAEGLRSDIDYCNEDFCAYPTMLTTLKVLGLWPATPRTKAMESLMYVGNEDFLYKNATGFHSYSHGKGRDSKPLSETSWLGFGYINELWNNYLKAAIKPQ